MRLLLLAACAALVACNSFFEAKISGPEPSGSVDGVPASFDAELPRGVSGKKGAVRIDRLDVNLNSCPVFVCPIVPADQQTGEYDPTLTPWVIGIATPDRYYPRPIKWQTELHTGANNISNWHYFGYSINTFTSMVNAALAGAYSDFARDNPDARQLGRAPHLGFNDATSAFYWAVNSSWLTEPPARPELAPGEVRVGINWALQARLDGWRNFLVGGGAYSRHEAHQSVFIWDRDSVVETPNGLVAPQTSAGAELLCDLRQIAVTSSSLPLRAPLGEIMSQPVLMVLTPYLDCVDLSRSVMHYSGGGRLMDLREGASVRRLQFTLWWVTTRGEAYPVVLARSAGAEVLFEFTDPPAPSHGAGEFLSMLLIALGSALAALVAYRAWWERPTAEPWS